MKRKIYKKLQEWKANSDGHSAVLIDGARRIGKSWIAEEFGKNEYKSYLLIDFNNVSKEIIGLFEESLTDLDNFFMQLSLLTGIKLHRRESLIIFDEIQMYPKARAAIKYLVKDGRYDYIETGSLVSINHNVKGIVIPSEEERLNMYPMDLEEFMWAIDEKELFDYVRTRFDAKKPLGDSLHRKMMKILRTYMMIGGMPQAVEAYVNQKDMNKVDAIKRNIIALYRNDISKYAGRTAAKVTMLFDNIPGMLQQHDKRIHPSKIKENARMKDFTDSLFWLDESRVVNLCYNATEPSIGLALNRDESKVKLYMADTGLLITLAFGLREETQTEIYQTIIRGKLEFNKGMLTENLVAQMLRSNGHDLYYYTRSSREDAEDRMEIDFLIRKPTVTSRHNISPIEVKSTTRYALSSLEKFEKKFKTYLSTPYVIHTKDLEIRGEKIYLPIYMAGLL